MRLLVVLLILLLSIDAHAEKKPLKVFLLVGQSNMQGHAKVQTFEHIGMDPRTVPLLREMQDAEGRPRVCDEVWISSLSTNGVKTGKLTAGFGADEEKIGPEFTFGITIQKLLGEPILIIKTAWGGKSLHTDFRPPGAGAYEFSETQIERIVKQGKDLKAMQAEKAEATGHYYREMMAHAEEVLKDISQVYPDYDPKAGYELAGVVWFQGWNDMVDSGVYPDRDKMGGYDNYSDLLSQFIRDVRKDLSAPTLPFVIGVMGVGGPVANYGPDQQRMKATHQNFRDAMAAPAKSPEFRGSVAAVLTENYWDEELSDLVARDEKIKQVIRKLKLGGKDAQAKREELRKQEFPEGELEILEKGVSNAAYHYLGSAKIMAGIGKGFAEAMAELQAR